MKDLSTGLTLKLKIKTLDRIGRKNSSYKINSRLIYRKFGSYVVSILENDSPMKGF